MTENKAIRIHIHDNAHRIEALKEFMENNKGADERECKRNIFALEEANKALSEIQQYRSIGTVDECREARERQRAKKPNGRYKTRHMWDGAYCPMCRCGITARWNFCQSCGQAIDWSDI